MVCVYYLHMSTTHIYIRQAIAATDSAMLNAISLMRKSYTQIKLIVIIINAMANANRINSEMFLYCRYPNTHTQPDTHRIMCHDKTKSKLTDYKIISQVHILYVCCSGRLRHMIHASQISNSSIAYSWEYVKDLTPNCILLTISFRLHRKLVGIAAGISFV